MGLLDWIIGWFFFTQTLTWPGPQGHSSQGRFFLLFRILSQNGHKLSNKMISGPDFLKNDDIWLDFSILVCRRTKWTDYCSAVVVTYLLKCIAIGKIIWNPWNMCVFSLWVIFIKWDSQVISNWMWLQFAQYVKSKSRLFWKSHILSLCPPNSDVAVVHSSQGRFLFFKSYSSKWS